MLRKCEFCGEEKEIAGILGICVDCIRNKWSQVKDLVYKAHAKVREKYGLSPTPPTSKRGIKCDLCSNECVIGEGESGYCGLRFNEGNRLVSFVDVNHALLYSYLDAHPTNCCSVWFCPAGTGAGYPKYAYTKVSEYGYYNLAVFINVCIFDFHVGQNYSHKDLKSAPIVTRRQLIDEAVLNDKVSCVCYFGGSPEPQLPFAIKASEEMIEEKKGILRICWEWNGCGNKKLVRKAAELSFISGGNVKFDLKAFTPEVSIALSGVPNKRAYENFEMIYKEFYNERRNLPILTATTLLVPGYVDEVEVEGIAKFISELDPEIPYSLLVFHPDFRMKDLPITRIKQVEKAYSIAKGT